MVIDSTLKCVQTYHVGTHDVNLAPGRNLIRDDVGRALLENKAFQEMVKSKAIGFAGQIVVTIPPAPDPATVKPVPGGKTPVVPPDGETAVSGMNVPDAVKIINECSLVDQLQDILQRDTRAGVKKAAEARIEALAAIARSEQSAIDEENKKAAGDDDGE